MSKCDNCGRAKDPKNEENEGTWWNLTDYYSVWGYFCPDCFELVSHNSNGPNHPKQWKEVVIMQALKRPEISTRVLSL